MTKGYCDVCQKEFANMAQHIGTKKHIAKLGVDNMVEKSENPIEEIIDKIIPPEPKIETPEPEVKPEIEGVLEPQKQDSGIGTILTILALPFLALVGFLFFLMMKKGGNNYE